MLIFLNVCKVVIFRWIAIKINTILWHPEEYKIATKEKGNLNQAAFILLKDILD